MVLTDISDSETLEILACREGLVLRKDLLLHNLAIRTHRLVLDTPDDVGAITRQHQVMQKQILSQDQNQGMPLKLRNRLVHV